MIKWVRGEKGLQQETEGGKMRVKRRLDSFACHPPWKDKARNTHTPEKQMIKRSEKKNKSQVKLSLLRKWSWVKMRVSREWVLLKSKQMITFFENVINFSAKLKAEEDWDELIKLILLTGQADDEGLLFN